jgi:hypothetical protein
LFVIFLLAIVLSVLLLLAIVLSVLLLLAIVLSVLLLLAIVLSVLLLLAIVLSVLLRYTDYDYSFGIFKLFIHYITNGQTSGESASLPQSLGCNTVFDMRLRVTFFRQKTVSLQSNIAHRE